MVLTIGVVGGAEGVGGGVGGVFDN